MYTTFLKFSIVAVLAFRISEAVHLQGGHHGTESESLPDHAELKSSNSRPLDSHRKKNSTDGIAHTKRVQLQVGKHRTTGKTKSQQPTDATDTIAHEDKADGFVHEEKEVLNRFDTKHTLKYQFEFYHDSEELIAEAKRLAENCGEMKLETIHDQGVTLHHITVSTVENERPNNKVFLVAGEHAREIIGPETALHLLKALCRKVDLGGPSVDKVLKNSEFKIILNGNPRSRRKVEAGQYCVRLNPNGVDLNRNWDTKWQNNPKHSELYGGPHPFSEPETRMLRKLIEDFKPTTFLSIHSGTRGLYMPWAYDMSHTAHGNQDAMMRVLQSLDSDHCQCPYGAAGTEVGYKCPGTSLDWVYDKLGAPYSFAFEIWGGDDELLKKRWRRKLEKGGAALLHAGSSLAHPHFREFFEDHPSEFIPVDHTVNHTLDLALAENSQDPRYCLEFYNPIDKESYNKAVKNWALAYMECSVLTAEELQNNSSKNVLDIEKRVLLVANGGNQSMLA